MSEVPLQEGNSDSKRLESEFFLFFFITLEPRVE